jgi:hypothetical protein
MRRSVIAEAAPVLLTAVVFVPPVGGGLRRGKNAL